MKASEADQNCCSCLYAFITLQFLQYSKQTFNALNNKKQAIFFSLLRRMILMIPLTCLLPDFSGLGTDGGFKAEPVLNSSAELPTS